MGFPGIEPGPRRGLDDMMAAARASRAEGVVNLALGDPDLGTDARVIAAAFEDARRGYTHYAPAAGDPELLELIRSVWFEDLGVRVAGSEVLVTASGCQAMWLLLTAILEPGDEVVIFSPFFSPYPEQIALAGGLPVEVATSAEEGFEPDPAKLEGALSERTKAVIVNSPCNPTGAIIGRERLGELLGICIDNDLLLIADDIYTAYAFSQPFVAAASLPEGLSHVATIRSFSKDFCMSGWRLGYVVAPSAIIAKMMEVNESNVYVAPTISQRAALHALQLRDEICSNVHDVYQQRMQYTKARIESIPYLALPSSAGGLYAFVDIRASGESSLGFSSNLLAKHRVSTIPGSAFGGAGEGFVRLALREEISVLEQVFDALEQDDGWAGAPTK